MNQFKSLTDEMYKLYESCRESGFDSSQAFELTKTYCSVAFVNNAIEANSRYRNRESHHEILRRYSEQKKAREERADESN